MADFGHDSYYQGGGFPISKEGRLKFGFRGRKVSQSWTRSA